MDRKTISSILAGVIAAGTAAAYTVTFVGNDNSTVGADSTREPDSWGESVDGGCKSSWRSTDTAAKAYVLPDHANAYGMDGYICFGTSKLTQEEAGDWQGLITSGKRSGSSISKVTRYVSSFDMSNRHAYWTGGVSYIDDPTAAIVSSVAKIKDGNFVTQFNTTGEGTNSVFLLTFNDNVADHQKIRVGFAYDRGDSQNPGEIIVGGVPGQVTGSCSYGLLHWSFFDIDGAVSGDTVEVALGWIPGTWAGNIVAVSFDSVSTFVNAAPVIEGVSATPETAEYANWKAESTLLVSATDADGDALSYYWEADGVQPGGYTVKSATSASCDVSLNAAGTYTFKVTVTDANNATVSTNVQVMVTMDEDAPHAAYVGFESSSAQSGGWGAPGNGFKGAIRTLTAGNADNDGMKNFLLPEHQNAYGLDGYIFPGIYNEGEGDFYHIASGETCASATTISNATDYIASFDFLNGRFDSGRAYNTVDDPRLPLGESVADFAPGEWLVNTPGSDFETAARITFGANVVDHPQVRIMVLAGRGDDQKPSDIRIGGVPAAWVGARAYGQPDWAIFDILNARPGDTVDIDIRNARNSSVFIQGIIFDSVSTVVNDEPEIASASATPDTAAYSNWKAEATLSVTATDTEGDELSYLWTADGEQPGGFTLDAPAAATCPVTLYGPGTYSFLVGVSDAYHLPVYTNVQVTVTIAPGEPHAAFVGFESSNTANGGWGAPDIGYKGAYRSLAAGNADNDGMKNFLLPAHTNAYGLDGYVFPGIYDEGEGDFYHITSGAVCDNGSIVSNAAPYVASVDFLAGEFFKGGAYSIDDPRLPLADEVADVSVGEWRIVLQDSAYLPVARITFGRQAYRHPQTRIMVLAGRGDNQKPSGIRVGGVPATWVGNRSGNAYGQTDWAIFDILGARNGDSVDIEVRNADNNNTWIQGIIFDSVEIPEPGTILLLR